MCHDREGHTEAYDETTDIRCSVTRLLMLFVLLSPLATVTSRHVPTCSEHSETGNIQEFSRQFLITPFHRKLGSDVRKDGLGGKRRVFLLVVVVSDVRHVDHRRAIRATWGDELRLEQTTANLVFLVGTDPSDETKRGIVDEAGTYDDILQVNITETKQSLTSKSVSMLHYVNDAIDAEYLLKCDDDTLVNIPVLIRQLNQTTQQRFIMGDVIAGAEPIRDKDYKWYTPTSLYPEGKFPTYISGAAYVISGDIVDDLIRAARVTPMFWIEDVYITAMCAKNAHVKQIFNGGFHNRGGSVTPCAWRRMVSFHRVKVDDMRDVWREISRPGIVCPH